MSIPSAAPAVAPRRGWTSTASPTRTATSSRTTPPPSGRLYRERNVKALLDAGLSDADAFALLAEDGMLVKRPIVVGEDFVLVGFREAEWEAALL